MDVHGSGKGRFGVNIETQCLACLRQHGYGSDPLLICTLNIDKNVFWDITFAYAKRTHSGYELGHEAYGMSHRPKLKVGKLISASTLFMNKL